MLCGWDCWFIFSPIYQAGFLMPVLFSDNLQLYLSLGHLLFLLALFLRCLWTKVAHKHIRAMSIFLWGSHVIHYNSSPSLLNLGLTGAFLLCRKSLNLFPPHQVFLSGFSWKIFISVSRLSFTQRTLYDVKVTSSFPLKLLPPTLPMYMGIDPKVPVRFPLYQLADLIWWVEKARNWAECPV